MVRSKIAEVLDCSNSQRDACCRKNLEVRTQTRLENRKVGLAPEQDVPKISESRAPEENTKFSFHIRLNL